jgi:hypothetical protein
MSEPGEFEDLWDAEELVDGVDEPAAPSDGTADLEEDVLASDPVLADDEPGPPYGLLDEPPS